MAKAEHWYIEREGPFRWVARSGPDGLVWENYHGTFRTAKQARARVDSLRPYTGFGDGKTEAVSAYIMPGPYKGFCVWEGHEQRVWNLEERRMVAYFKSRRAALRYKDERIREIYNRPPARGLFWRLKRLFRRGKI